MKRIIAALAAAMLAGGCSTYRVRHTETGTDGVVYTTEILERVPPGGKKLSEGAADIGVDEAGAWHVRLGADVETDATGTAALIEAGIRAGVEAGLKALLAQNAAGVIVPAVEAAGQ